MGFNMYIYITTIIVQVHKIPDPSVVMPFLLPLVLWQLWLCPPSPPKDLLAALCASPQKFLLVPISVR